MFCDAFGFFLTSIQGHEKNITIMNYIIFPTCIIKYFSSFRSVDFTVI